VTAYTRATPKLSLGDKYLVALLGLTLPRRMFGVLIEVANFGAAQSHAKELGIRCLEQVPLFLLEGPGFMSPIAAITFIVAARLATICLEETGNM
jgi:hypothetical protein